MRRFYENRTVRGLAIVALIALVVVVLSLESVLASIGGLLGIVAGGAIAWLVDLFSPFPAVLQPFWVVVGFSTAVMVGLVFGLWPALKASRLDPIEALRYE